MSNPADLAIDVKSISTKLTWLEDRGINKLSVSDINDETQEAIIQYIKEFNSFFLTLSAFAVSLIKEVSMNNSASVFQVAVCS